MAVLASFVGGFRLPSSERCGAGWLKAELNGKEVLSLPVSDPYMEIYTVQDNWCRLITPEWVNPANSNTAGLGSSFIKLKDAKAFHQDIGSNYHPTTYLGYCADDKQKAWGAVVWKTTKAPFFEGGRDRAPRTRKTECLSARIEVGYT